jgi:predicted enzyme related to lactoylglutathione lyase
MSLDWEQTIIDARDPAALGRWWQKALGWVVVNDDPDEFEIRPTANRFPGLLFGAVPEPKTIKNRLHLDFRPDDRDTEVERMLALGATRADVGQGNESWVVLADPEGNEFCILSSRPGRVSVADQQAMSPAPPGGRTVEPATKEDL